MNKPFTGFSSFGCAFFIFCSLAVLTLAILFYHSADMVLAAMDAPAFWFQRAHVLLKECFFDIWSTEFWLGQRYGPISPDLNALILKWLEYPFSLNILFSLNLLLGATGMYFLLRGLKINLFASFFGSISYLLTNTTLTLVYPGHVNKVMTYAWIPFSIATFLTALRKDKIGYYIISGAFLGLSLLGGEVQIPYYLGLWYAIWLLFFHWIQKNIHQLKYQTMAKSGVGLLLVAICSLVLGLSTTLHSFHYLSENNPVTGSDATFQNWRFATQFYFPPEEILSYFTTIQFFGGPHVYWGRDGNPTPLQIGRAHV